MASAGIAAALQKVRQPFQANLLAQEAALAALEDEDHVRRTVEIVDEGRAFLEAEFKRRKIEYIPSSANFVILKVDDGQRVFQGLMRRGVIVRPMQGYKLPAWIRVTVGTQAQNEMFLMALEKELAANVKV